MQTLSYLDHYDVYASAVYSPIGILASLLLMFVIGSSKESREFPGNLLLVATTAQIALQIKFIMTPQKILSMQEDFPLNNGFFSSELTFIFSAIQSTFHLSFLFAIIFLFSKNTKPKRANNLFWILPLIGVVMIVALNTSSGNEENSKNLVRIFNETTIMLEFDLGIMLVILSFWALSVLNTFIEERKYRIGVRDDFCYFYQQYAKLMIVYYSLLVVGYLFFVGGSEVQKTNLTEKRESQKRINTVKFLLEIRSLFPLFALWAKTTDRFTHKLLKISLSKMEYSLNEGKESVLEDSLVISRDVFETNKVQSLKEAMARSIVKGVNKYYRDWMQVYEKADDGMVLDHLVNILNNDQINSLREIETSEGKFGFECEITSFRALDFNRIIANYLILDIQKSFNVNLSDNVIRNPLDQTSAENMVFNFMTWDQRFQVRSLNKQEFRVMRDSVANYSEHICDNKFSFLSKLVGLFSFRFVSTSQKVRIAVFEKILMDEDSLLRRKYELKGHNVDRQVLVKPMNELLKLKMKRITDILRDVDFVNLEGCFYLKESDWYYLNENIKKDVEFLRNGRFVNYSLMVGVVEIGDLNQEQLARFEELSSLKLAFFDFSKNHVLFFGISNFSEKTSFGMRVNRVVANLRKREQHSGFVTHDCDEYAAQFLRSFGKNFKI